MNKIQKLKSLSSIVSYFDTYILDLWGVMHDGKKAYKHANDCVEKLNRIKKNIIIISNSSQSNLTIRKKLIDLGFNIKIFSNILTSGQTVYNEIKKPSLEWTKNLGKNCFHLSKITKKNKYKFFFNKLNLKFVNNLEKADFIIASSADPLVPLIDYVPFLKKALENNLPFVCLNPDFESVETNKVNKKTICMGSVAKLYESFGGKVHILGKPKKYIYEKATHSIANFKKSRTIAIGDSIHHDILGAHDFGVKSMLITSGIHKDLFKAKKSNIEDRINSITESNIRPNYICERLIF